MFREACAAARNYTIPVIIPHRTVKGDCFAALGSAVVLNSDGWIITAAHIGEELSKMSESAQRFRDRLDKEAEIRANKTLKPAQRKKQFRALGRTGPKDVRDFGVMWGAFRGTIKSLEFLAHMDIAVGRLEGVDMSDFPGYPSFRRKHDITDIGASICRVGYPFASIETSWDDATNSFTFPNGIFPVPMFANEGIVSRFIELTVDDEDPPLGYMRRLIETSSPGLKGQSGGPIFDAAGRVWGIQSHTYSYDLGFTPEVKNQKEHQFLNVGRAVDSSTVCDFLDEKGISYQTE